MNDTPNMKTYKINYNSPSNVFKGEVFTDAESSPQAMDTFLAWLREQSVWVHLWDIQIQIKEIGDGKWI